MKTFRNLVICSFLFSVVITPSSLSSQTPAFDTIAIETYAIFEDTVFSYNNGLDSVFVIITDTVSLDSLALRMTNNNIRNTN